MEDRGVVAPERRQQEVEHVGVRRREVDVPAPDPFRARRPPRWSMTPTGCGSWTTRSRSVGVDLARVQLLEVRGRRRAAPRSAPAGCPAARCGSSSSTAKNASAPLMIRHSTVEPRVLHQRDERVLDLGDAAAERRRGELEHARAGERRGELADLVHQPAGRDRRVVRKRLVTDVDELEHARGGARSASARGSSRSAGASRACRAASRSRTRRRSS